MVVCQPGFPGFESARQRAVDRVDVPRLTAAQTGQTLFLTEHGGDCQVGGAVYFRVPDARACFAEFTGNGVVSMGGVVDTPWGTRELLVTDPDGNRLRFASDV